MTTVYYYYVNEIENEIKNKIGVNIVCNLNLEIGNQNTMQRRQQQRGRELYTSKIWKNIKLLKVYSMR